MLARRAGLLKDVQEAIIPQLEYFRRRLHAEAVALAKIEIDDDFHGSSL